MSVKKMLGTLPEGDKRVREMAVRYRLASWMDICYPVALVVVATFCANLEQASKVLGGVCYFGGTWYSYHGYTFFTSYKGIQKEQQLSHELVSDLRRMWITRFIVPMGMSLLLGSLIVCSLQMGWFGR